VLAGPWRGAGRLAGNHETNQQTVIDRTVEGNE